MKQIIPFKKELLFKTKVSEITSISLEHTFNLNKDFIDGMFHITGDYKMTEGSINREKFNFEIPFDIDLDTKYNTNSLIIDIDNFYYEIINNESLKVNIDVYIEGEKKEEIITTEDTNLKETSVEVLEEENQERNNIVEEEYTPSIELAKPEKIIIETNQDNTKSEETGIEQDITISNDFNIFENIDNSDTYITYYVYIVKEEDTIDKILEKYTTTKEELEKYNNLESIIPGTKLIIPSSINE